MKEIIGDIWDYHYNSWVVVTTNGQVKINGAAVMGRGIALDAALRHPELPKQLGRKLNKDGNHVYAWPDHHIFTFPTKVSWKDNSHLWLIERSAKELLTLTNMFGLSEVYMPRPGCGNGGLTWDQVKPVLYCLDDRFKVVTPKEYV